MTIALLVAALLMTAPGALASQGRAQPPPGAEISRGTAGPARRVEPNRESLAEFFGELIPAQLERRQIPGAVVVVVQDGGITYARGYGWADLERQVPVEADRTLFHLGSTGKLFTWTAVMQLVEQGRLDLDADVNAYLDFRIPATYPQPITLRHLMTHTAGFENRDFGWLAASPEAVTPLGSWLAANLPARVRPPGVEAGYSNYGTALAGYIVERVSGLPYQDYVEQQLLGPLQMERSTVRQRVPPNLAPDVAKGYVVEAGVFQEVPLHVYQGVPAGTIRAPAPDVGRFMLAHLQDGRAAQGQILQEATARRMRQTLFRPDPRLNGLAHGFLELDRNGERIVGHLGSAVPAHYSLLALLPERGLGLFVAYNADTARPLTVGNETLRAFVDHFYPAPAAEAAVPPDFAARAGQYVGEYQRNNFGGSYTTVEKVGRLLGSATNRRINNPGDGTLEVASRLSGSTRFVEVAPDFFRQVDGPDALLFSRDRSGRVTSALFHGEPIYTFERLAPLETAAFNLALLLACLALFGSTLLASISVWIFRRQRVALRPTGLPQVARRVALATAGVQLLFLVGLFAALADPGPLMGDFSRLRLLLILPLIGTVLAAGSVAFAVLAWWRRFWSLPARLHYTAVALAGVSFTWFLATWNLLGFRL